MLQQPLTPADCFRQGLPLPEGTTDLTVYYSDRINPKGTLSGVVRQITRTVDRTVGYDFTTSDNRIPTTCD
ncbi:hypothetical protein HOO68_05465 [Candidatus Gracilibacteria bacterium]|nr:hypothetical protein [Candidatus Gracilibacteria bacterium]